MRVRTDWRQAGKREYSLFCDENPDIKISYLDFQNIIYSFNYSFRDYLLETGMKGKLPWGIGDFAISKKKPKRSKMMKDGYELVTLPVDWKKSKQLGKKVYHLNHHTEGFKFKLKWFIDSARFKCSGIWSFKPYRETSRLINHYIQMGKQHTYYEWDNKPLF